ncbi:uncharacterized protein LOC113765100 [Coffea eugenioides]|uniref:cAMP-regulated phosphoprotein 19-related protein n=1 Tax=Coffea arabica TaxID=13443 RepID=A0A6P6WMS1_COFAR|nr:uncharacterized protein LOC113733896 [Coffea arabica]XP_027115921.1 uncharacterized protein LOC113733896 [Coffea arabica]XP_027115922.1 uncharacterized protein LOC113733896 [Coffea arabica]XP_027119472.1 uncharacterized protein LOC113736612 [Coffea arabica]XP_027119473.1 uncharacterized protein LOC113736612 [Coffea arabica]XP_027164959.1 uncharacterized protein LOC113765100 [Coffea eugenioides]XP_027164960.1 uncharacterized protein LOC113765100 [Coffea eugenioides]
MAGVGRSEEQHQHRTASATENHEVASQDKKYGGIVPKKKPLISKDPERAFFDSADWALCKQGAGACHEKSTVAVETLRPKLQRTPHQQLPPRRPTCTSGSGRDSS